MTGYSKNFLDKGKAFADKQEKLNAMHERRYLLVFSTGIVFVFLALTSLWYFQTQLLFTDTLGKPVVCQPTETASLYSIDRPECQKALKSSWKRTNSYPWKGKCNDKGVCEMKGK